MKLSKEITYCDEDQCYPSDKNKEGVEVDIQINGGSVTQHPNDPIGQKLAR
jgi:hypothetical protein